MSQTENRQLIFDTLPVPKAVTAMVLPAIISQIIHVVYNLADTWFVGLTGDPNTVAAISLCLPVYNILTGLSNLFGVGGASVIARFLGAGNTDRARRSFAVASWGAGAASLVYALLLLAVGRPLLLRIGADQNITPREVIRDFIELLDLLYQNPNMRIAELLESDEFSYAKSEAVSDETETGFVEFTI